MAQFADSRHLYGNYSIVDAGLKTPERLHLVAQRLRRAFTHPRVKYLNQLPPNDHLLRDLGLDRSEWERLTGDYSRPSVERAYF